MMPERVRAASPTATRTLLGAALLACLAFAACEETPEEARVLVELSTSPSQLNFRYDEASTVSATVFGVSGSPGPVAFRVDTLALNALSEEERGAGGFQEYIDTEPPDADEELPQSIAAPLDADGRAWARFRCTAEGRVPLQATEVSTGVSSELKTIRCTYRDPDAFAITMSIDRPSAPLGASVPITITVDDQHGGAQLVSHQLQIRAPDGGVFEPEMDQPIIRALKLDEALGLAVPNQTVTFLCPEETGLYELRAEFLRPDQDGDNEAFTFIYCSSEEVRNTILLQASDDILEANGVDETVVVASVLGPNGAEPDREVTLSTDRGGFRGQDGAVHESVTGRSNGEGRFTAAFIGGTDAGEATLTASATLTGDPEVYRPNGEILVQGQAQVKVVGASFVRFESAAPSLLGVKGSGFNETSRITFQIIGSDGEPFPAGLRVEFEVISNVGGASLSPTVRETDENGYVATNLVSGVIAANVSIRATAIQNGVSGDSPAIPIVGVRPSYGGFAMSCDLRNVGAFQDTDGLNSLADLDIPCRLKLKDRFGNPVGLSTAVSFRSEAGTISASVNSIPQGDSSQAQADAGNVTAILNTFGVLPMDVPPMLGHQHSVDEPVLDPRRPDVNPRDGLVTVLAFVAGEEWFNDENGNGDYDQGEQFIDLPEPFVDYDDNGVRDGYEPFIDLPGPDGSYNGRWDPGNRRWDRNSTIWTETRIMYSGLPLGHLPHNPYPAGAGPEGAILNLPLHNTEMRGGPDCPQICTWDGGYIFNMNPAETCMLFAHFVDARGNLLNASANYGFEVDGGVSIIEQAPSSTADQLGLCWGLVRDCGPSGDDPVCSVRAQIDCYHEALPHFPLDCQQHEIRRLGHLHWVQIAHPTQEIDPFDPPVGIPIETTARFSATLRLSPSAGDVLHSHRHAYWGRSLLER